MIRPRDNVALSSGAFCESALSLGTFFNLSYHWQTELSMLFALMFPVISGISALIFGTISDHVQRIKISRVSPLLFVVAAIIAMFEPTTHVAVIAFSIVLGIATGIEHSVTRTVIAESAKPCNRFKCAAETVSMHYIAVVFTLFWLLYFHNQPFLIRALFGIIGVCAIIIFLIRLRIKNPKIQDAVLDDQYDWNIFQYFSDTRILKIIGYIFCTYIAYTCIIAVLSHNGVYHNFGYDITYYVIYLCVVLFAIHNIFVVYFPNYAKLLYLINIAFICLTLIGLQSGIDSFGELTFAIFFGISCGLSPNLFYQQWVVEFTPTRYRGTMRGIFSLLTRLFVAGAIFATHSLPIYLILQFAVILYLGLSVIALKFMPNSVNITLERVDRKFDITSIKMQ